MRGLTDRYGRPVKVWYVYPQWHRVSFTLIAEKHIEHMKKYVAVEPIDELAFPHIMPSSRPVVFLHPFFYPMSRYGKMIQRKLHLYHGIIGVDVADSDHISNLAVSMTNYAKAMVVPSSFARKSYVRSGVTVPVYVVPHGLDREWYEKPSLAPKYFSDLLRLKERRGYKLLLFFLWHSSYRKGYDIVLEIYKQLLKERKDVKLVFKTGSADGPEARQMRALGAIHIYGWLTEEQKMALYDACDMYILATRGGGFEMNGLEAIARGLPTIAARGGAWDDYLPDWLLVDSRPTLYVLKDNPIHDGRGVEMLIKRAVDKIHDILENLDDYKARVREHVQKIKNIFTWEYAARRLVEVARWVVES